MTTGTFSTQALESNEKLNICLVDRDGVKTMLSNLQEIEDNGHLEITGNKPGSGLSMDAIEDEMDEEKK